MRGPSPARRLGDALEELWIFLWGWIPTPLGVLARMIAWKPLFASCGTARFAPGVSLRSCRGMRMGDGVRVGRGCILTAGDGSLEMGEMAALSPNVMVDADHGSVRIGRCVAVGPGTVIRAANHRFADPDTPVMFQGHERGEIVIEEDVWIGAGCVVTPDVRIGRGAVVGAGAVVTRDVEPFSVVAGVPARPIGSRRGGTGTSAASAAGTAPEGDDQC